jgi:hypothetical protein
MLWRIWCEIDYFRTLEAHQKNRDTSQMHLAGLQDDRFVERQMIKLA